MDECNRCGNCCKEYLYNPITKNTIKIAKFVTMDDILKINRFVENAGEVMDEIKKINESDGDLERVLSDKKISDKTKRFLDIYSKRGNIPQIILAYQMLKEKPIQLETIGSKEHDNIFEIKHKDGYCTYYTKNAGDGLPGCGIHIVKPNCCIITPANYKLCDILFASDIKSKV
jgi:hypothetical protein